MFQRDENKPKAVWTLIKESGLNRLYQSNGGAVKITREDQDGEEKLVLMCPARMYAQYALVTEFINETANDVAAGVKSFKDNKDKEKIKLQVQVHLAKTMEHLKSLGFTAEQIAETLKKVS